MNRHAFMITASGREHYVDPSYQVNTIDVRDIAHALSLINRFTGATRRPYSVAEHSLLVADFARRDGASAPVQLAALVHDAHEAYVGDVSSPLKQVLGGGFTYLDRLHADAVRRHFDVSSVFIGNRRALERWDLEALATEREQLTAYQVGVNDPWPILDTPGEEIRAADVDLMEFRRSATSWLEWKAAWLSRYGALCAACQPVTTQGATS